MKQWAWMCLGLPVRSSRGQVSEAAEDSPEAPVAVASKPRSRPQETGDPGEVHLSIIMPSGSSGSHTTR